MPDLKEVNKVEGWVVNSKGVKYFFCKSDKGLSWFTKDLKGKAQTSIPEDKDVIENIRTGLPLVKKQKK